MADATAKFRLLGEDATSAAFRSALGNAQSTASRMSGMFRMAFAGISVAAVSGVAARAIDMGDELQRAGIKAGIGGRAISELAHAAKMADVELAGLSVGLRYMQTNLSNAGSGTKSAINTLSALGLEFKDIKDLAADKQFELLADRISQLRDPADKARAATELFGRAGADLLPMFEDGAEGIRKAREEAEKLGKSFSDEQIGKMAEADDAIKRLNASWEGFAFTLTAAVAPALTNIFDLLSGNGRIAKGMTGDMAKNEVIAELNRQINSLSANRKFNSPAMNAVQDQMIEDIRRRIQAIESGAAGPGGRRGRVVRGEAAVGYAAGADAEAAAKAAEKAEKDALARRLAAFEESSLALQQLHAGELELQEGVNDALEEGNDLIADMGEIAIDEITAVNEAWREQSEIMREEAEARAAEIKGIFDDGIFAAFEDGADAMLDYWADTLKKMAIQAAATEFFNMGGGGIGKAFSSLFGFADGGRPPMGRPSIVGERGPELFVPDGTGTIIPNHKLGGGGGLTINVDARGAQKGVAEQIVEAMRAFAPTMVREAVNQSLAIGNDRRSRGYA
jgi:hypothetical protein